MKKNIMKRMLSILICLALLMSFLPVAVQADQPQTDNRVADPATMDGWKQFFLPDPLNTENAGGVWTDKSVFIDETAFAGTGITRDRADSFLAALSAMASNMTVTGMANVPTDTVMILDLSSSMYEGYDRDPDTVQTMLTAVNESIEKLQNLNVNNRVGVVVYYGGVDRNQSDATNSMVLLPLDRYSAPCLSDNPIRSPYWRRPAGRRYIPCSPCPSCGIRGSQGYPRPAGPERQQMPSERRQRSPSAYGCREGF